MLGHYRRHAGGLSADPVVHLETLLAMLAKAARDPHLTAAQREILERQRTVERTSVELQKGKKRFCWPEMPKQPPVI